MGASPRARAQPLGFSDTTGINLSTDVVPVLNHEAVAGGLARAHDVQGIKVPDRHVIIISRLMQGGKLVQIIVRTIHDTGTDPCGLGMMQPEGNPQQSKLEMQKGYTSQGLARATWG